MTREAMGKTRTWHPSTRSESPLISRQLKGREEGVEDSWRHVGTDKRV
jgi:hypothetical protein